MSKRVEFTKVEQLTVWQRDAWHCRYCLHPVFFAPTLRLLDQLNPGHGYYQQHGKHGEMVRLFATRWASVDHIQPVSLSGTNCIENLATACMDCNILKSGSAPDSSPPLREIPTDIGALDWDGFMLLYPKLVEIPDDWTRSIEDVLGKPEWSD